MGVNPPTGEEQDVKYQGSPYLDEVNAVKEEVHNANVQGRKPDVSDFHPTAVEAVNPNLLKKDKPKAKAEKAPAKKAPAKKAAAKK